ncbi:MAG: hypothetical protein DRP45_06345 [Candidatus Zixiibacteriota bacterium]|nr:MAG: hypothetical protein DRP45_06345 [candidate division Zixibacteria bacterium]
MGFCPVCKFEYQPGINICPDCNETLVSQLPTPTATAAVRPDDSWVGVCRIAGEIRSELARGALDSNNIPSMVTSSAFGSVGKGLGMIGGFSGSGGSGEILMVPQEFREEAEIILEAVLGEDFDALEAGQ